MNDFLRNDDVGKLILRLTLGVLLLFHGISKFQHPGTVEFIADNLSLAGWPAILSNGVYFGEIIAPALIMIGILTRYSAAVVIVNMLFAIFLMHSADIFSLTQHGGWRLELQGFYLFGAVAMVFFGSGNHALIPD